MYGCCQIDGRKSFAACVRNRPAQLVGRTYFSTYFSMYVSIIVGTFQHSGWASTHAGRAGSRSCAFGCVCVCLSLA